MEGKGGRWKMEIPLEPPWGTVKGSLLGDLCTKKEGVRFICGEKGSGKLQSEAFISLKRSFKCAMMATVLTLLYSRFRQESNVAAIAKPARTNFVLACQSICTPGRLETRIPSGKHARGTI